ncbi:hypothetical protein BGZ72_005101 [Mortierella alpina]|nr:hypothetical protein BGZ72_005101 [Mortierella alpina]
MSTALLIRTLQDLKGGGAACSSRSGDLDAIAKRLQVDNDFRIETGQIENVWNDIAFILSKAAKDALNPEQVQDLTFIFRIVRNGVAGVTESQNQARIAKLPQQIQEVVSQAAHTHYGNLAYILLLRAGVQALSNLATGNEVSKDEIWCSLLLKPPSTNCDQYLLSTLAAIDDESVVLSTVMLCYNCVFESRYRSAKEERKSFEMIYTLFNHLISQGFFKELFEALAAQDEHGGQEDYKIRYHGENTHGRDEHEEVPKIQELKVEDIEDEEMTKKGTARSYLSMEQVVLLKMVDSKIYAHHERLQEHHQEQQQSRAQAMVTANEYCAASDLFEVDETDPAVNPATVELLSNIFAKASTLTIDILKTLDQPGVGSHGVEDLANLSSGLMLLLGCLSHLSLHEENPGIGARPNLVDEDSLVDDQDVKVGAGCSATQLLPHWFKAQHMTMVNAGVVENAIELLRQADKSLARVTKPVSAMPLATTGGSSVLPRNVISSDATSSASETMAANTESSLLSNTSTLQGQQSFFVGLKRDIVRLVGNLAYRSRHVQDRIRQCNGLIVMLSQCNIDDANPYLREYAILAMKNILSGNPENQALIEELQPIEAVDHPALQEARVTSRLDAETGRPVLSQKPRPE